MRGNFGDKDKVHKDLFLLIEVLEKYLEAEFVVHCAYETDGHKSKGYHPRGMAADGHFETGIPLRDQYTLIENCLELNNIECGLGVYPHWNNKGFHLDVRGHKARWMRDKEGNYVGINIDEL